jgi:4,5-dihydroxyphthalate decarboxylase
MERNPERSHGGATGFKPPAGIDLKYIPPTTNIGEMLVAGELDATLRYLAGRNLVDRSRIDLSAHPRVRPLFPDRAAEGRRYYAKTGIYPINHTVVVRRSLMDRHPWIALNLFSAFVAARQHALGHAKAVVQCYAETGLFGDDARRALERDPMAYGVKAARPVLETIAQYVHEQGLTDRPVGIEELFAPSTLDL